MSGEDRSNLYTAIHTALLDRAGQEGGGQDCALHGGQDSAGQESVGQFYGGQNIGGQYSGGQESAGQDSGGQYSGGQKSGSQGQQTKFDNRDVLHTAMKKEAVETAMECVNIHDVALDNLMDDKTGVGTVKSEGILDTALCDTAVENESEETCDDDSLVTNINSFMEENYDVFKCELKMCDHQETQKRNLERNVFSYDQSQDEPSSNVLLKIPQDTPHQDMQNRTVHEGVKFHCEQCGHQATSKGCLARHEREVHEGVKYPCGQCGLQFNRKESLARHKRAVHEGVKYP